LNYRHAFHAGNFADLVKHAALLALLAEAQADAGAVTVIDTHAGRGLYDLASGEAQRSGEAEAGIGRLAAAASAPAVFRPLLEAVRRLNGGGPVRRYPGSPWLAAEALRPQDRLVACELRAEEHVALRKAMNGRRNVETLCADGYQVIASRTPATGKLLVLIDPPFERADDYARCVGAVATARRRNPAARVLAWLPLKDLETFDAFLRDLEDETDAPLLVAETRMRPLADPLRMNGCALVLAGAPGALATPFEAAARWTAETLGPDGEGRVYAAG
jgi:23S rRNA (adenine2030-N6)-methyltransferase